MRLFCNCKRALRKEWCYVKEMREIGLLGEKRLGLLTKECCSVLQCVAVCCSVLQCVAVRCNVLHTRPGLLTKERLLSKVLCKGFSFVKSAWSCVQHIATHCNTLQRTATHCSILQDTCCVLSPNGTVLDEPWMNHVTYLTVSWTTYCKLTATHCNTLQHTLIRCNACCVQRFQRHGSERAMNESCHACACVMNHTLQHTATPFITLQHTSTQTVQRPQRYITE